MTAVLSCDCAAGTREVKVEHVQFPGRGGRGVTVLELLVCSRESSVARRLGGRGGARVGGAGRGGARRGGRRARGVRGWGGCAGDGLAKVPEAPRAGGGPGLAPGRVCAQAWGAASRAGGACVRASAFRAVFPVPSPARLQLGPCLISPTMASALEELQKDLEEVKVLLEKANRKRVRDALTVEKSKIETEIKNKMQQKSQRKAELLDNEKPAAVVAPITTGYTVKISNYGWDQSDKFVKIYITLTGVHQVPTENVQVHFTERSFDLLVKNLNGKSYSMIVNNLLKPISVEGSSKKVKTDTVLILCRKKAENTRWDYLTQVEKECKEKEKPSYDTETDPSEGLMNVLKKIYEDGDDDMKRTINKAWVESREKQAKGDTEF
uniref:Calcyclin-binding protein n=1 Tax=Canis lupus familiaris TaxID=9615 RepID=A0A8I3RY44_CANLF